MLSFACLLLLLSSPGCYYLHLAEGQTRLLWRSRSVDDVRADPATSDALRRRFDLVDAVRDFARELGLDVGGQYTSYVAWPGDRIVTTVVAARPGETEAAGFRFPLVGRLPYKGFFDASLAEREAAALASEGMDTCLVPVRAYSTLGWLDDPLTEPMLGYDDLELVETLIHEFVHATVHLPSAADFNESVASFIGQEGAVRFLATRGLEGDERSAEVLAQEQRDRNRDARAIATALLGFQSRVADLYAAEPGPAERERRRQVLERQARGQLAALPLATRNASELAEHARLGDACLSLRGTYAAELPRHAEVFGALGGDLTAFVARLRDAAAAHEEPAAAAEAFFAVAAKER